MSLAQRWARRRRFPVMLNLDELTAVLAAARPPARRHDRDLDGALRRIRRAADRRRRAIARAKK